MLTYRYLVEEINLCIGIARITRMPQQQLNEAHERVEGVEALYSDARHHLAGLGQRTVTQVDTHLRTQAEEARYQVVGLEDALQMHLSHQSHMHMVWYCDGHIQGMATCGVYLICNQTTATACATCCQGVFCCFNLPPEMTMTNTVSIIQHGVVGV